MKKVLAILLTLMLILVNVAALSEGALDTSDWTSDPVTFQADGIQKTFKTSGTSTSIYPVEPLNFTSTPDSGNPDDTNVEISAYTPAALQGFLEVKVPSYSKVGLYKYTITENDVEAQGVTKATNSINLLVYVIYNYEEEKLEAIPGIALNADKEKENEFENTYALGKLTVSKTVSGNMGDQTQLFDVTVKLTASGKVYSDISVSGGSDAGNTQTITGNGWTGDKEINIKLKHGESVEVTNIPVNVTYTVTEASAHAAADPNYSDGSKGYTVKYDGKEDPATGTITTTASSTAITNEKNVEIDTGISMETVPYIMILALALIGAAVLFIRKKEEY